MKQEKETGKDSGIPITVRQLEAIIRISESLSKMPCDCSQSPRSTQLTGIEALAWTHSPRKKRLSCTKLRSRSDVECSEVDASIVTNWTLGSSPRVVSMSAWRDGQSISCSCARSSWKELMPRCSASEWCITTVLFVEAFVANRLNARSKSRLFSTLSW